MDRSTFCILCGIVSILVYEADRIMVKKVEREIHMKKQKALVYSSKDPFMWAPEKMACDTLIWKGFNYDGNNSN